MKDAILNFAAQFSYEPDILNSDRFEIRDKFIIAGMGGSNLAAEIIKIRDPYADIIVHRNYGLPALSADELRQRLFVANSYSGNTEETVDALEQAVKNGFPAVVVATGGRLIELAQKYELPHIQMPNTGIQPRSALGFNLKAILKIMGRTGLLAETGELFYTLKPAEYEAAGKNLAEKIKGRVPVIYSSLENLGVAYNWKIKFNETGKIPAFYNVFSELNHNEMTGFDVKESSRELSRIFHFIFLKDEKDRPQIRRRMDITRKLYEEKGLPVEVLELSGENVFHKIFSSLILADWAAYYTAEIYGLESEQVPMVEEFKKLIA